MKSRKEETLKVFIKNKFLIDAYIFLYFSIPPGEHGRIGAFAGGHAEAGGANQNKPVSSIIHHQRTATVALE